MESGWDQLSRSSQRAFQFAWAAAQERTSNPPPSAVVDGWDLLVGMLLADPGKSEAEQTLRHFSLVVGQALPVDYPRLTAEILNRRLALLPANGNPPVTPDVQNTVQTALQFSGGTGPDKGLQPRALWVFLLQNGPASTPMRDLLTRRGVNVSEFEAQLQSWLSSPDPRPYADVLQAFPALPVDVVNYKADLANPSHSGAQPAGRDDFVGISTEVDAFAYLLASRSLEPPLAVGLFGDWGSGKSFFLDAIRRRIDQLSASESIRSRPQRELPFWKRIIQVEFNAWHYVEGDLWSSLVDHIFTQLNFASEKVTENAVERRQRYLLRQLDTTAAAIKALEEKEQKVAGELQRRQTQVEVLTCERDAAIKKLKATADEKVAERVAKSSSKLVSDALRSIELQSADEDKDKQQKLTLGEAIDSLSAAQAELEHGRSLLRPFLDEPRLLILLLIFLVAAPAIAFAIERSGSTAGAFFGGLVPLLTMVGTALGIGTRWVRKQLNLVYEARQAVNKELSDAEAEWKGRLKAANDAVNQKTEELEKLNESKTELGQQLASIQRNLEKKPPELLYEFLRERLDAGEYRKRLGVPAIIRRDFKSLADLISYQNAYLLAPPEQRADIRKDAPEVLEEDRPEILNRIILYIDDLDRCPDGKVIEVLQAVHLLLAFPLFVVVVAVDSRWLAHALQSRYPALAGVSSTGADGAARPDDYLEKIFQIPFWVAPLTDGSRGRIVRGLLGDHVRPESAAAQAGANGQVVVGVDEAKVLAEMIDPRSGPPMLDVNALTIGRKEFEFLDQLAPLMGDTPRSVKRFVNVFQLVKILRRGRVGGPGDPPPEEHIAAFLLAVAEGLPELSWRLFDAVSSGANQQVLSALINTPAFASCQTERQRLSTWLAAHPDFASLPAVRMASMVADVSRFLFNVAPRSGSTGSVVLPQVVHLIREK